MVLASAVPSEVAGSRLPLRQVVVVAGWSSAASKAFVCLFGHRPSDDGIYACLCLPFPTDKFRVTTRTTCIAAICKPQPHYQPYISAHV